MRTASQAVLFTVPLLFGACRASVITCDVDSFCVRGARTGQCIPAADGAKYCAFSDPACTSGLSWDRTAADPFANSCVLPGIVPGSLDMMVVEQGAVVTDLTSSADAMRTRRWKPQATGTTASFLGVWGNSVGKVYVVGGLQSGEGVLLSTDDHGANWSSSPFSGVPSLTDVWGTGADSIYVSGAAGTLFRWNGTSWKPLSGFASTDLLGHVWGPGPDDVYVVSSNGVRHSVDQGQSWKPVNLGGARITGVGGTSYFNLFAFGAAGAILQSVDLGVTWTPKVTGTTSNLVALWAHKSGVVVAVASDGTIVSSNTNGAKWTVQDSGTTARLTGVWGSDPSEIHAVGINGTILRSVDDGKTWTPEVSGTTEHLMAIWGSGPDDVYVVGGNGTVLHLE